MKRYENTEIYRAGKIEKIRISSIRENRAQPRTDFDAQSIERLADSIAQNGLLQPLSVRRIGREYELIAGERRLRALKSLKREFAPCIVVTADEKQSAILAIIENIQRQDLNIFEQAEAISCLISKWSVTQSEAAVRLGLSQPAVANKLRLLKFSSEEQRLICEKKLTERHARTIIRIPDRQARMNAVRHIAKNRLNVEQSEKYVDRLLSREKKGETKLVFKDLRIFINTINMAIDTMRRSGVMASATRGETDGFIEYNIKIPKPAAQR